MKKLRLFDSLKLVVAVVAACVFAIMPAHADTNAIQSVIAYGKTEQSGTPTPTTPVPIMTNNGELKVNKNLLNPATVGIGFIRENGTLSTSGDSGHNSSRHSDLIPVVKGLSYTFSGNASVGKKRIHGYDANSNWVQMLNEKSVSSQTRYILTTVIPNNVKFIRVSYSSSDTDVKVTEGTSADELYVNGLVETIRDAAGHKATAQMLLGLNDEYRDEQNITTGAITRRVGVKVLDGTEDWIKNTSLSDSSNAFALKNVGNANIHISYCSHFSNALNTNSVGLYIGVALNFILGSSSNITTVEQFKSWLAEQYANGTPVIVVYPLATETTESVTAQQMTTAPVRQTLGAIMNMPIKTILTDNTEIMSGANELIKIATTKYNEESFEDVQDTLTGVFNAVDTVVTQTMSQAQAIDTIATTKQTRPDETCPVGKNCLLVEDEQGVPHWYVIAGADEANPSTNP